MSGRAAVVLAAGKGVRMKSDLPKVLVPVHGRAMIHYVLDALDAINIERIIVVVGYRADLVRTELSQRANVEFAEQNEQLGTGHAVQMCGEALAGHEGTVLILAGDSPMVQASSLQAVFSEFDRRQPACLLGTLIHEDPTGLGRILRDADGQFDGIVEHNDATEQQREINEVNMSTYLFSGPQLLWALSQLSNDNAQGEYYLTDCPGILKAAGHYIMAAPVLQACEALSINTPLQLKVVEDALDAMSPANREKT
jgi:bifunctional UDP-N-acetylglucosamine pyrophosphorylase/glucosamine-1-phosphate N-acetyltransferase/UDP-N-acetylglucosamine pyrophosphorylase